MAFSVFNNLLEGRDARVNLLSWFNLAGYLPSSNTPSSRWRLC